MGGTKRNCFGQEASAILAVAEAQMKYVFSPHCGGKITHKWYREHTGLMSQKLWASALAE